MLGSFYHKQGILNCCLPLYFLKHFAANQHKVIAIQ